MLERRPHSVCPHQKVKIHGVAYIHIIASETAVCVTADKHSLMCHVTEERGHGKFCRRYLPAFVSCFRIFEQHVAAIYVMLAVICLGHVPQSLRYHHVVRVYHYDDIPIGICYAFIESIAYAFILFGYHRIKILSVFVHNVHGRVCRTAIYYNIVQIIIFLVQYTFNGIFYGLFTVVRYGDYGYSGIFFHKSI